MSIESAVYARLAASPAIGATVALGQRLQGSALPAVTFVVEQIDPIRQLSGTAGLYSSRLRCSCWAATYAAARTLADAVIVRMSGWTQAGPPAVVASRHASGEPSDMLSGEGEEDLPVQIDESFVIHHT